MYLHIQIQADFNKEYKASLSSSHRDWLESQPALVMSVVYSYLSILPAHSISPLTNLREEETQLCVSLLRDKVRISIQFYPEFRG